MASTRKSPTSSDLPAHVTAVLKQHVKSGGRLLVGLSGGVDSVVLLDLLRRLSKRLRLKLAALHVNHQINPAAGRWAAFCRSLCRRRRVALTVVRVKVPYRSSLEAGARAARYRAFAAQPSDFIVLAHNLDDQAETVFLQLLRGAGVKGLSAMPELREVRGDKGEAKILRPLLEVPRSEIEAYARQRKLKWIEDDSNADLGFDRNFLRHRVLPVIAERYPSYRRTLLRASRNLAEAAQLLDELAAADATRTTTGLGIAALRRLSTPRAKNVMRYFLAAQGITMPNAARLDECVRQLLPQRATHATIDLGDHELRRYADELRVVVKNMTPPRDFCRTWRGESRLDLPELGGTLVLKKSRGAGISLGQLTGQPLTVRLRQGGERIQPHPERPRRSLKHLLQESRVPPWLRDRLPLLYCGDELAWVAGIGVGCRFRAGPREASVLPLWLPSRSLREKPEGADKG
jgi:tRNA(Ile)-lysidine synthase